MTFCGLLFLNLLLLLGVVGLPLHGGEADVELLDDGGVQTVEVEQQHKLVVETYGVTESESHTHSHARQAGDIAKRKPDSPTLGSSTRPPA